MMKINSCLFISIIIFVISTILIICQFFDYTDIHKEGIRVSNGIFSRSKEYKWNDVTSAEVSYKRGNKNKIEISYDIYLDDGKIVHALNSKDFFKNIIEVDNLMNDNKIEIDRKKIISSDYGDFTSDYYGPENDTDDRLKVVSEIFKEPKIYRDIQNKN